MTDFDKDSLKDSIRRDIHDRIHDRINDQVHDQLRGRIRHDWQRAGGPFQGMIWGGAVCVVGIILLLDHLGIISAGNLWRFWPLWMIAAGAINLTQPGKRPWGAFLVVAGVLPSRGRRMVNSVKAPTSLSTTIVPPCCCVTMS